MSSKSNDLSIGKVMLMWERFKSYLIHAGVFCLSKLLDLIPYLSNCSISGMNLSTASKSFETKHKSGYTEHKLFMDSSSMLERLQQGYFKCIFPRDIALGTI